MVNALAKAEVDLGENGSVIPKPKGSATVAPKKYTGFYNRRVHPGNPSACGGEGGIRTARELVDKMCAGLAVVGHQDSLLESSFRRLAASVRRFFRRARLAFAVEP